MHVFTLANPLELTKALAPDLFFMGGAMLLLLVAVWRRESSSHQRVVGWLSIVLCAVTLVFVSIAMFQKAGRQELVDQEQGEINIIERYLPKKMSEEETNAAIAGVVAELGASTIKDMGRVMAALKERYAGRMDFAKVGQQVKQKLG